MTAYESILDSWIADQFNQPGGSLMTSLNLSNATVTNRSYFTNNSGIGISSTNCHQFIKEAQMRTEVNTKIILQLNPHSGVLLEVPLHMLPLLSQGKVVDLVDRYDFSKGYRWSDSKLQVSVVTSNIKPSVEDEDSIKKKMEAERDSLLRRAELLSKEISES